MVSGHIDWLQRASLRPRQRAAYLDFWVTEASLVSEWEQRAKAKMEERGWNPYFFTPRTGWFSFHLRQFWAYKLAQQVKVPAGEPDPNSIPQIYMVEGKHFSSKQSSADYM